MIHGGHELSAAAVHFFDDVLTGFVVANGPRTSFARTLKFASDTNRCRHILRLAAANTRTSCDK